MFIDKKGSFNKNKILFFLMLLVISSVGIFFVFSDTGLLSVELLSPANFTWTNVSTINFTCNASAAGVNNNISNVTVYTNFSGSFTANKTNGSEISNNTATNFSVSGIPDGAYVWNCEITDNSSTPAKSFAGANYTIFVDSTVPAVSLLNRSNNTWFKESVITFTYGVVEANPGNCTIYGNFSGGGGAFVPNESDSEITSNSVFNHTIRLDANGTYIWNVLCNDTAGNAAYNSTNLTFFVDNFLPNSTINGPANNTLTNGSTINFSWTTTDNLDAGMVCNVTINGTINKSGLEAPTNVHSNYSLSGIPDGSYVWNISCWDNATNHNYTLTNSFTVDASGPVITLNSPTNASNLENTSTIFSYSINENANCTLWIKANNTVSEWNANVSNVSLANTSNVNVTVDLNAGNGTYIWNVKCNDTAGNINFSSANYSFTIDTEPVKNVTLIYPFTETVSNSTVNFTWLAIDDEDYGLVCNITINGTVNVSGIEIANDTRVNYSISGFNDGNYTWNVSCWDNSSRFNISINSEFEIDTLPHATLLTTNDTAVNTNSVTLSYLVTDTNIQNCTLYHNFSGTWASNITNNSLTAGNVINNTVSLLGGNGSNQWNVFCNDTKDNTAYSTQNFTVLLDTVKPATTLILPADTANQGSQFMNFSWNVTDNVDNGMVCNLSIDDVSQGQLEASNGTQVNISVSGIAVGVHTWHVNCSDNASNSNSSGYRTFTINAAAAASSSSSGGSSSGGGGVTTTIGTSPISAQASFLYSNVQADSTIKFSPKKSNLAITGVEVEVNKFLKRAKIVVSSLKAKPAETSDPADKVYQFLEIEETDLTNEDIKEAKITFKVTKKWLVENNVNQNDVNLLRYDGAQWKKLDVSVKESDSETVTFVSMSPGFSFFAITGSSEAPKATPETFEPKTNEPTASEPVSEPVMVDEVEEEESNSLMAIIITIIVVIALIIGFKHMKAKSAVSSSASRRKRR